MWRWSDFLVDAAIYRQTYIRLYRVHLIYMLFSINFMSFCALLCRLILAYCTILLLEL